MKNTKARQYHAEAASAQSRGVLCQPVDASWCPCPLVMREADDPSQFFPLRSGTVDSFFF